MAIEYSVYYINYWLRYIQIKKINASSVVRNPEHKYFNSKSDQIVLSINHMA